MDTIFIIALISMIGPIIGSFLGVMKIVNKRIIFHMLAFAAGVMISISFLELIPEAIEMSSIFLTAIGVLFGAAIMFLLDKFIPHYHPEPSQNLLEQSEKFNMKRTAKYLIAGIFIHNFPEGIAIAATQDPSVSITIALAIAIHNIPEGICTSAPYYYATGKKLKAFLISSSTALPVLLGFIVARFLFVGLSDSVIGFVAAATAGLMIYISADELIPSSCRKICDHRTITSLIIGIIFTILLGYL